MSDPHLLVDHRDELLHLAPAALRHFQLEGAGEMQRLDVEHPGVGHLIVGPFSGGEDRDLVLARPLERPAVAGSHPLDDLERVAIGLFGKLDEGHAWSPPWTWNAQVKSTHTTPPLTQSPVELSDRSGANHLVSRI